MLAFLRHYCRLWIPSLALFVVLVVTRTADASSHSYTVQPGDTLYRIAIKHGVTTSALAEANHIVNPRRIYVGQVLIIPGAEIEVAHEDDEDDEVDEVDTVEEADEGDGESSEVATQTTVHVVQRGETLSRIALQYGVTAAAIQEANNLANANVIFAGQRLTIPAAQDAGDVQPAPATHKRVVVDKSEQRAYVSQDGELLWTFVVSTGMPGSATWEGTFHVRSKIPNAYASVWDLQMPYWLGFYHTGYLENGFHALPIRSNGSILWEGYLGTPVSYGCVILNYADAQTLYQWAEIGTEVVVQP